MAQQVARTVSAWWSGRGHQPGRRRLLQASGALAGIGLLSGCGVLPAQGLGPKTRRIGTLSVENPVVDMWMGTWKNRMTELGHVDGQGAIFERRSAKDNDGFDVLAKELVDLKVDVIMAAGYSAMAAAKQHTSTIPIVGVSSDPVGTKLVSSIQRPGGNITGVTTLSVALAAKRVEVFKDTIPGLRKVGVMWNSKVPDRAAEFAETEKAMAPLNLEMLSQPVQSPADFVKAFDDAVAWKANGLILLFDQMTLPGATHNAFSYGPNIDPLAGLMEEKKLPAVCDVLEWAEGSGGLTTYGPNFRELFKRAAEMTDKILSGTKPADIPIEGPSTYILTINLDVAAKMGITIPNQALSQAQNLYQQSPLSPRVP
jgi:ABC-type uncharacterized transport system substrate-binding protein